MEGEGKIGSKSELANFREDMNLFGPTLLVPFGAGLTHPTLRLTNSPALFPLEKSNPQSYIFILYN